LPRPPRFANTSARNQPRRVLVVDDNADNVESLCSLLQVWGYEAEAAQDGKRALARVASWRPLMVVMDLGLPDGDALDVIHRIKAEDDDIIIIAFSGWKHLEAAAVAAGAGAFVLKPDLDSLEKLLAHRRPPPTERRLIATKTAVG
jgi:CheY-like chemotaxis protein